MENSIETIAPSEEKIEETEFEVLGEHDQELLVETGLAVSKKILEDFPNELPDVVIFPDMAARPLTYLFDEVFTEVSAARGVMKPEIRYFQPNVKNDAHLKYMRNTLYLIDRDTGKRVFKDIHSLRRVLEQKRYNDLEGVTAGQLVRTSLESVEKYEKVFERLKERMMEIIGKEGDETSVAVIDEQALEHATTLSEIRDTFKAVSNGVFKAYAMTTTEITNSEVFSGKDLSPVSFEKDPEKADPFFWYRATNHGEAGHRDKFGVRKVPINKNVYVERDPEADVQEMGKLRRDMNRVGKRVVEELNN